MKKTFAIIAAITFLIAGKINAQLQKGNALVGADIANFDIGLRKNTGFDLALNPKAAWFIKNNLALGGFVNFGVSKANKQSATYTTYGVGPLARYYMNKPDMNMLKHGRWFGEAAAGIQGANVSDGGGSTNGFGLTVGPGYAYFITPNIGIETLLEYQGLFGFGDLGTQSDLVLKIGFQIYLPGRATVNRVNNSEK